MSRLRVVAAPPDLGELEPPKLTATDDDPLRHLGELRDLVITGYDASCAVLAEPVDWIWEGVIASSHQVEACGQTGSGKSLWAFGLAVAMANPGTEPIDFLGRKVKPMAPGRFVLIVNEENGKKSAVTQINRWIEILGLPPRETWARIVLASRLGLKARDGVSDDDARNPAQGDLWASLLHAASHDLFGLIVLDTRARIFRQFGDTKNEDSQAAVSDAITELVELATCPVIVVSHLRKGGGDDLDDVSGSAQRAAGADVVLGFRAERSKGEVLSTTVTFLKLRDGIEDHPEPIAFAIGRDDAGRWRCVLGGSAKPTDQPAHERVFALLHRDGEKTKTAIAEALKINAQTLERAISVLFAEKRITKEKVTIGGRPRDLFRAKQAERDPFDIVNASAARNRANAGQGVLDNEIF